MNAATKTPTIPATSDDVANRIHGERRRLLIEQNLEVELNKQRIAPLEAGDDEALDRVEAQISQCLDRQSRIRERIEILEQRLAGSVERERSAALDALTVRADEARILGVKLTHATYPKQAKALVATLKELADIEALIQGVNAELVGTGRSPVLQVTETRVEGCLLEPVHETVCLPNSEFEREAYWAPRDAMAEMIRAQYGSRRTELPST